MVVRDLDFRTVGGVVRPRQHTPDPKSGLTSRRSFVAEEKFASTADADAWRAMVEKRNGTAIRRLRCESLGQDCSTYRKAARCLLSGLAG